MTIILVCKESESVEILEIVKISLALCPLNFVTQCAMCHQNLRFFLSKVHQLDDQQVNIKGKHGRTALYLAAEGQQ